MFEKNKNLNKWREKYDIARSAYSATLNAIDRRESAYLGTHSILNHRKQVTKREATNVRNISFELVEAQVDSTIPVPRVDALHAEDKETAKMLESFLRSEIQRLRMKELNDQQERTTPTQGGDFALVEWDNLAGTHCSIGDIALQELHPKQVIPQPGVYDMGKMDYFFVVTSQTKESIKRKYGIDAEKLSETEQSARESADETRHTVSDDLVTQIDCYYRTEKGIGKISWADSVLLYEDDDYQQRKFDRCRKCGKIIPDGAKKCECGSKDFETETGFELQEDMIVGGQVIDAEIEDGLEYAMNPDGTMQFQTDESGNPIMENETPVPVVLGMKHRKRVIPYYKPNVFPVILRRNISCRGQLLGLSDVDVIADQQEDIKAYGTKIREKILKGGSYLTKPRDVKIRTDDTELKILEVTNPQQVSMMNVLNIQPNIEKEQTQMTLCYDYARSTLGITDAFQGKYDASATSGTAKQFSANQSAGRLMSKRVLKYDFYSKLYETMFKFLLAYSDRPIPYSTTDANGETVYSHFDPMDFLKVDADGEPYWNDEFLFSVDESATIASNKEMLWNMADVKYQSGAFGPINDLQSADLLWTWLEATGYPMAGSVKRTIEARIAQQTELAQGGSAVIPQNDGIDGRSTVQQSDLTNLEEMGMI